MPLASRTSKTFIKFIGFFFTIEKFSYEKLIHGPAFQGKKSTASAPYSGCLQFGDCTAYFKLKQLRHHFRIHVTYNVKCT